MRTVQLKVARIGNSRGIRLPADTLQRYHIRNAVLMEERPDGILLQPEPPPPAGKLSWEETARQMAAHGESWGEWDATAGDGMAGVPWEHKPAKVAEPGASCGSIRARGRKRKAVAP